MLSVAQVAQVADPALTPAADAKPSSDELKNMEASPPPSINRIDGPVIDVPRRGKPSTFRGLGLRRN
jgi:hypothetical protein